MYLGTSLGGDYGFQISMVNTKLFDPQSSSDLCWKSSSQSTISSVVFLPISTLYKRLLKSRRRLTYEVTTNTYIKQINQNGSFVFGGTPLVSIIRHYRTGDWKVLPPISCN